MLTAVETQSSFWSRVLPATPDPVWCADAARIWAEAQQRRRLADYNTGSIPEAAVYLLRALCEFFQPRVVIEVGTFIGTSAHAMASASSVDRVYTCDVSNDCLESDQVITTFPRKTSTRMLERLVARRPLAPADLCFFDGVVSEADAALLQRLTHASTVYVFDDYCYGPKMRRHGVEIMPRKGIGNVAVLSGYLPRHVLIEADVPGLALLVPESRV